MKCRYTAGDFCNAPPPRCRSRRGSHARKPTGAARAHDRRLRRRQRGRHYARLIAQAMSDRLGQKFVIENRSGAGGNVATELWRSSAGRLHHPEASYGGLHQPFAVQQSQLRFHPRHRAGRYRDQKRVHIGDQPAFPAKTLPNSSPTPRPIRARSASARPAPDGTHMPANCSSRWPASTWCTCPIGASRRRSTTSWAGRIQLNVRAHLRDRASSSARASFGRWRSRPSRSAPRCSPTSRQSPKCIAGL